MPHYTLVDSVKYAENERTTLNLCMTLVVAYRLFNRSRALFCSLSKHQMRFASNLNLISFRTGIAFILIVQNIRWCCICF